MDTFTITDINAHSDDPEGEVSFIVKFQIDGKIHGQCISGIDTANTAKILEFMNVYAKSLQNQAPANTPIAKEIYALIDKPQDVI